MIEWPVYCLGADGWVYRYTNSRDLAFNIEVNDYNDHEISHTWDHSGRPLRLVWNTELNHAEVQESGEEPNPRALIDAIQDFARKYGQREILRHDSEDIDTLFSRADRSVGERTSLRAAARRLLSRVKSWLKGLHGLS